VAQPYRFTFTLQPVDVLGTIPDTEVASLTMAQVSPITIGPVGPRTFVFATAVIYYGGKLERGNDFGTCQVTVTGSYEERVVVLPPPAGGGGPGGAMGIFTALVKGAAGLAGGAPAPKIRKVRVDYIGTSSLTVNPPNPPIFTPAAVKVAPGRPGPEVTVDFQITPKGPYEVVFRTPPNSYISVLPTLAVTGSDGKGTVTVRDLIGEPRGPIPVTGTISPQSPFTGTDVVGTFSVTVAP
jgi:hypothetical protein